MEGCNNDVIMQETGKECQQCHNNCGEEGNCPYSFDIEGKIEECCCCEKCAAACEAEI